MKSIATLILNRNLPKVTDKLFDHINEYDGDLTDIYVIEAGSDHNNLSKYTSWHANWDEAMNNGLRYARGMNYGLLNLINENKFKQYDSFFLITNDTELENKSSLLQLEKIMKNHNRLAILSPCSSRWGERYLLTKNNSTKYFWFIHNTAYFIRREFIELIMPSKDRTYMNLFFDGNNFRGYGLESEIIAKAYINNWAAAITSDIFIKENDSHLIEKYSLIKTDSYDVNIDLYLDEGRKWMMDKYGFCSKWSMQQYVKCFYDNFFEFNPEYNCYKI